MAIATGKTAAWGKTGNVYLYVSSKRPPTDPDWNEYLAWLRETAKETPVRTELLSIVYDRSTGPNASQRKQLTDATVNWKLRVAVVTPSTVARGVVTAMNWFKKDAYEAFPPEEFDRAIKFLGVPTSAAMDVRQAVNTLIDLLDGVPAGR